MRTAVPPLVSGHRRLLLAGLLSALSPDSAPAQPPGFRLSGVPPAEMRARIDAGTAATFEIVAAARRTVTGPRGFAGGVKVLAGTAVDPLTVEFTGRSGDTGRILEALRRAGIDVSGLSAGAVHAFGRAAAP